MIHKEHYLHLILKSRWLKNVRVQNISTAYIMTDTVEGTPRKELPPFTLANVLQDVLDGIHALLFNPFTKRIVAPLIIMLTSMICKVIITKVAYTEIDFSTYMQQIHLINEGEIDYKSIEGDSGPIVYPAGFVQIYQFINWLTNEGTDIYAGQLLFSYLLAFTNLLVCCVFGSVQDFPPWPLYMLIMSKRLFSIYVLRLFNDCFTTASMVGVTLLLQQASYWYSTSTLISFLLTFLAGDLFSIAISIKMNALLYLPAFVIVAYFLVGENILKFIAVLLIIPFVQVMMGWKFLLPAFDDEMASTIRWNYINNAFNFKRKFLYEWTVNWRFLGEEKFLSDEFASLLLVLHVFVLLVFIFTRYLNPKVIGKSLSQLVLDGFKPKSTISTANLFADPQIGPRLVLLVMATTNVIGVLFSRSLHYQFLSWYCWQLPFLLYATNWNFIVCFIVWTIHELCWNVFPSTPISSLTLVTILSVVIASAWNNTKVWFKSVDQVKKDE